MHTKRLLFFLLCCFFGQTLIVHGQVLDMKQGEVIVQFRDAESANKSASLIQVKYYQKYQVERVLFDKIGVYLLRFDESKHSMKSVLKELRRDRDISYAQSNHLVEARTTTPNDPFFSEQWYLQTVEAEDAWDITTGGKDINGRDIVLAVMDNGFDIEHEDLAPNLWINEDEIPDDGIDNDSNGFADDYFGWNFRFNNDSHGTNSGSMIHGTNVAGIAGARGDNDLGISGTTWDVKLMFLSGLNSEAEIIEAYRYISETRQRYNETDGQEGAYVVASTISLGIRGAFSDDHPIWCNLYDVLGENGVLNVCATDNLDVDVDVDGDMPTTCTSEYMIAVTNTDRFNSKTSPAAYGAISIDIGAPGVDNITTNPDNNYSFVTGTSVSAPIVGGAIALLYSAPCQMFADQATSNPSSLALSMRSIVYGGADRNPSLEGIVAEAGVLNLFGSMKALDVSCSEAPMGSENTLKVIKNPVMRSGEDIQVEYTAQVEGNIFIRVFDEKGALVIERSVNRSFFGPNLVTLPSNNMLSTGVYIVSMSLPNNESLTEKVVLY